MLNRGDFLKSNFENKSLHELETYVLIRLQIHEPETFPRALQSSCQQNGLIFFHSTILEN